MPQAGPPPGRRVVLLSGERLSSPATWVAELDGAIPRGDERAVGALLLSFREHGYTPTAGDAMRLVESLVQRFGEGVPPLATVARTGAPFGGTRVLVAMAEMRGCKASAFLTEADAWMWIRAQLRLPPGHAIAEEESGGAETSGCVGA